MAVLPEDDTFPEGVYRIETTDPVLGGPPNEATGAGISNVPAMHLAKRTRWLKNRVDTLISQVVAATTAVAGLVRLNTTTNSTSTTEAATPSAVKAAMDNANTRALSARTISASGLATGGGDLTANRTITVAAASEAEAEAGVITTKAMTPLGVAQAIAARIASGVVQGGSAILTSISGLAANGLIARTGAGTTAARTITAGTAITVTNGDGAAGNPTVALTVATQAEAEAGVITTKAMTPLGVAQAIGARTDVVRTTGDQNVAGNKTMSGRLVLSGVGAQNDPTLQFGGPDAGLYLRPGNEIGFTSGSFLRARLNATQLILSAGVQFAGDGGGLTNLGAASEFARSLAASGFQRLPGGLILQWGNVVFGNIPAAGASVNVTFPLAFPTACVAVNCGLEGGAYVMVPVAVSRSVSGCTIFSGEWTAYVQDANAAATWLAIGY